MEIMDGLDVAEDDESSEDAHAHGLVSQIEHLEAEAPGGKGPGKFVFPFANTVDYYLQLFLELANVGDARGLVLITSTMHPRCMVSRAAA